MAEFIAIALRTVPEVATASLRYPNQASPMGESIREIPSMAGFRA